MNAGKAPPAFTAPIRKPADFGSRCRLAARSDVHFSVNGLGTSCSQGQRHGRHDLHRRTLQLMRTNRSAPLGPVIPELAYPDVGAAVQWLVDALGFVERVRIGPGHRAQLSFGTGSLIVADVGHGRSAPTGEESPRRGRAWRFSL